MKIVSFAAALIAAALPAQAQDAVQTGAVDKPCTGLETPQVVSDYFAAMVKARAEKTDPPKPTPEAMKIYLDWDKRVKETDFSGLCKYNAANAALPAASANRVVFFGDSITELWGVDRPDFFTGDVINRGYSGQTTSQMIGRFRADVIDLHPKVVHIIAGTNDIAGNTGPTSLAWIENNLQTMVELARAHGIKVILGATPPAAKFAWKPQIQPAPTVIAYNRWLADYAKQEGLAFIDYPRDLDDGQGGFIKALSDDGVHPNSDGYKLMTPRARAAIDGVLKRKK